MDFVGHLLKYSILAKLILLLPRVTVLILAINQKLSVSDQF